MIKSAISTTWATDAVLAPDVLGNQLGLINISVVEVRLLMSLLGSGVGLSKELEARVEKGKR